MKFTDQDPGLSDLKDSARAWLSGHVPGHLSQQDYFELLANLTVSIARAAGGQPLVLSIAGAQGSGKSTITELLAECLSEVSGYQTAMLSLDDFYLTRSEREKLADSVHPMLRVRGVPGTHDLPLMNETLTRLRLGEAALVPVFDKALDDRTNARRLVAASDIVLCEGWCWGARPEPRSALEEPVNSLEAEEDPDGVWREYVNTSLEAYQAAFASDGYVFLEVPDMEAVYRWRWEQEQAIQGRGSAVMDKAGVRHFVAYYERLTRWMLQDCPGRADVLVRLDASHQVADVRYGPPD